jgi:LAO/AO transport system kinase
LKHTKPSIDDLRSGDTHALARGISTVENHAPGSVELLKELFPHTGKALSIGITGSPGAGKSTLVDQLAKLYRNTQNPHSSKTMRSGALADDRYTVGIIAVDPTSPYTGGAILGDRIRMQQHFSDPGIYIRSMATRGSLGGLARSTGDVAMVLDAAGRDIIMIETVGVGQDEIDVVRVADVTIVILVPGMGDDVQTIKAGIMEIADIFVINKSDHEGSERVEREIRALQSLAIRSDGWTPPIVKTVATDGKGIAELASAIRDYKAHLAKNDLLTRKRIQHWRTRLLEMLRDELLQSARAAVSDSELSTIAEEIAGHKRDPYNVIEGITNRVSGSMSSVAIDHLGIAVKSLKQARRIYEQLGMRVSPEEVVEGQQVRLAMIPVGATRLELLEPLSPDSVIGKFISKRGEGLHHVSLQVPDLNAAVEKLKSGGMRMVSEDIRIGAGGHRYVFIHPSSAGGVLLELVEQAR